MTSPGGRRVSRDYVWLGLIAAVGLALRLWSIRAAVAGGILADPDKYVEFAKVLGDGQRAWHWTWAAVSYFDFYKAPLYQTVLSVLTANVLPVVTWALPAHALLNTCSVLAMYSIGRSLHNSRAGLIAAAIYAVWLPNIQLTKAFWQEHLYVPLLLIAFAVLARAVERPQRLILWLAAGTLFGAAALTRSSVMYYLPLAMFWLVASPGGPVIRRGLVAFLTTLMLVTVPYTIALSRHAGRLVPIEDIGSFSLVANHSVSPVDASITLQQFAPNPTAAPTGLQIARFLSADFFANPRAFVELRLTMARMLLKPAGGSALEGARVATRQAARWKKLTTHLTMDLPIVLVLALCPIGFAFSRQRAVAGLLLLWILSLCFLLALTMWAGLRFRAPIEPAMIVLASVALAGAWVRPRFLVACTAVVLTIGAATTLFLNVGSLLSARPSYGVDVWPPPSGGMVTVAGSAGLRTDLGSTGGRLFVEGRDKTETRLSVSIDGRVIDVLTLQFGETRDLAYRGLDGFPYLELDARTPAGQPAAVALGRR